MITSPSFRARWPGIISWLCYLLLQALGQVTSSSALASSSVCVSDKSTYLLGFLPGLNEFTNVKCLENYLAHINTIYLLSSSSSLQLHKAWEELGASSLSFILLKKKKKGVNAAFIRTGMYIL